MISFDENGFLSGAIQEWARTNRETYEKVVRVAEEINRLCHEFLSGRIANTQDTRTFVALLLFARMLELYQALILLNLKGMTGASSVVFRSHIEAHFHFDAIFADETYVEKYIDYFHVQRLRMANAIRKSTEDSLSDLRSVFSSEKLAELKKLEEESAAEPLSIRKVAEIGGNEGTYHTAYALLSNEVHVNSLALEKYLENGASENINIKYGPDDSELVRQLALTGMVMLSAYEKLATSLGEDVSNRKSELSESLRRFLDERISNKPLQRTGEDAGS